MSEDEHHWHPSSQGHRFTRVVCPFGHDKRIVGITKHGKTCRACINGRRAAQEERKRRREGVKPSNPAYLRALKYWRTHKGLTQQQLGDLVGVSKYGILVLENLKHKAFLEKRQQIALALGVTPGDLMMTPPGTHIEMRRNHMAKNKERATWPV